MRNSLPMQPSTVSAPGTCSRVDGATGRAPNCQRRQPGSSLAALVGRATASSHSHLGEDEWDARQHHQVLRPRWHLLNRLLQQIKGDLQGGRAARGRSEASRQGRHPAAREGLQPGWQNTKLLQGEGEKGAHCSRSAPAA